MRYLGNYFRLYQANGSEKAATTVSIKKHKYVL